MPKYARKLTKQDLINAGITDITESGRIFKHDIDITDNLPLNTSGYKILCIYDRDEFGQCIKQYYTNKHGKLTYTYKIRTVTLNRAALAWHLGELPDGYVADHINNKERDNYSMQNLQSLTPQENLAKDRDNWNSKETYCQMTKPREFYQAKLEQFLADYEQAKIDHDANKAHHLRSKISQTRARLRYWESHKDEYYAYINKKNNKQAEKDAWKTDVAQRKLLDKWKDYFKESENKAMWHQICNVKKAWEHLTADKKDEIFEKLNSKWPEIAQQLSQK